MKKLPIDICNFKELITKDYYYVDKSMLIKEILDDSSKIIMLLRPKGFGKTLNISMLKYFFQKSRDDNKNLFENLKISKFKSLMEFCQGQYPLISITFKNLNYSSFEECKEGLKLIITNEFHNHLYLLKSDILSDEEKQKYENVLYGNAEDEVYMKAIKTLSRYLDRYHEQKIIILFDECDIPIQSGFMNEYGDSITEFMREFISTSLKDNRHIFKAVLSGMFRISKSDIFSEIDNIKVNSVINQKYNNSFGFLEEEIEQMLKYYNIEGAMDEVREWYNLYTFGDSDIYNCWTILNYIKNYKKGFKCYFKTSCNDDFIKNILTKGDSCIKEEMETLLSGKGVTKVINDEIELYENYNSTENIWKYLLFNGYLKVVRQTTMDEQIYCDLQIPNLAVKNVYKEIITSWFDESIGSVKFSIMIDSIVDGDIETLKEIFEEFVIKGTDYFDTDELDGEKVYHAFVLGILIALGDDYEVKSDIESCSGGYDVMVIPKDINKKGLIFEFNTVNMYQKENLEKLAEKSLRQIKINNYRQEFLDRGINDITEIGVALGGKKILMKMS
ncbi:MAG: AAA family ATPase [Bacillota bacterium]|nr:AAA family ATPase [Bacillota bacterium]